MGGNMSICGEIENTEREIAILKEALEDKRGAVIKVELSLLQLEMRLIRLFTSSLKSCL